VDIIILLVLFWNWKGFIAPFAPGMGHGSHGGRTQLRGRRQHKDAAQAPSVKFYLRLLSGDISTAR
jgi:hypothetical protein